MSSSKKVFLPQSTQSFFSQSTQKIEYKHILICELCVFFVSFVVKKKIKN